MSADIERQGKKSDRAFERLKLFHEDHTIEKNFIVNVPDDVVMRIKQHEV